MYLTQQSLENAKKCGMNALCRALEQVASLQKQTNSTVTVSNLRIHYKRERAGELNAVAITDIKIRICEVAITSDEGTRAMDQIDERRQQEAIKAY